MAKLTAIIMAAGLGSRMQDMTKSLPKPLLRINNKTIIEYDINFLKNIGVDEIIVVGGYLFELVKTEVNKIDKNIIVIENKSYEKTNIYSLKCALDKLENSAFILYHADHIYQRSIAEKIKKQLKNEILIFTDNDRNLTNDDMKVKLSDQKKLAKVSKKLEAFELGYVGITFCPANHLSVYKKAMSAVLMAKPDLAVTEDVMQYIADQKEIAISIGDISGSIWHEVDSADDYNRAIKIISEDYEKYF